MRPQRYCIRLTPRVSDAFSVDSRCMDVSDTQAAPLRYNLSEEQERKEIVRQYRALLKVLKRKLKSGDRRAAPRRASRVARAWVLLQLSPGFGTTAST